MIRKIFYVAMIACVSHSAFGANAEYGPESVNKATFARLGGLYSIPSKVFGAACKSTPGVDFGVGHVFNPNLRAELTFSYRTAQTNKADAQAVKFSVGSKTLMLNFNFGPQTQSDFSPYINVGLGGYMNRLHKGQGYVSGVSTEETWFQSLSWQVGAGVYYTPCPDVGVDLQYRYVDLGKIAPPKFQTDKNGMLRQARPIKAQRLKAHEIALSLVFFLI